MCACGVLWVHVTCCVYMTVVYIPTAQASQIRRIFGTMIRQKLQDFDEDVKPLGDIMTQATVEVYGYISTCMRPTPTKTHYLFSLRDISKVTSHACVCTCGCIHVRVHVLCVTGCRCSKVCCELTETSRTTRRAWPGCGCTSASECSLTGWWGARTMMHSSPFSLTSLASCLTSPTTTSARTNSLPYLVSIYAVVITIVVVIETLLLLLSSSTIITYLYSCSLM